VDDPHVRECNRRAISCPFVLTVDRFYFPLEGTNMKIANDVTELIGNTPLVRLNPVAKNITVEIVPKLEFFNPVQSDHTVRTEKLGVFTTFLRDIESVFKRDLA
jgi:hypothetical protein